MLKICRDAIELNGGNPSNIPKDYRHSINQIMERSGILEQPVTGIFTASTISDTFINIPPIEYRYVLSYI